MLSMLRPVNIEILTGDQYSMKRKMDFNKSSLTNISVKQQREEYSLKKEAYGSTNSSSDNDFNDERSNKSSDDDTKKALVEESSEDEKKPSLIKTEEIKSYDILCGRDKATFNNVGNRRFRVLISLNIPRYEKATTKAQKASVIKFICDVFRNEVGVRFLKKHKNGEGYYELSVSEARKKVGHALRDMSVARQEVKKRRDEVRRNSMREQTNYNRSSRAIAGGDFDPLLEPLPISDEANRGTQDQQQQNRRDQHPHMPAHWSGQQNKSSGVPDLLTQHLQQQSHQPQKHQQQFTNLQEKLLDLQKQQQQLQQEREELLKQQQYQQELLELSIRNRRLRNQQEQMQQQQQQQQNQDDTFHHFEHFFDSLSRQPKRRR